MAFVTVTMQIGDSIEIKENTTRALGDRVGCRGVVARLVGLDVGVRWEGEDAPAGEARWDSEITMVDRTLLARYSTLLTEVDFSEYVLR